MAANGSLAAIEVSVEESTIGEQADLAHRDILRSGDCLVVVGLQPLAVRRDLDYFFTSST